MVQLTIKSKLNVEGGEGSENSHQSALFPRNFQKHEYF